MTADIPFEHRHMALFSESRHWCLLLLLSVACCMLHGGHAAGSTPPPSCLRKLGSFSSGIAPQMTTVAQKMSSRQRRTLKFSTTTSTAGAGATREPLGQTSSEFAKGFQGLFPASKAEVTQALQAEQTAIDALMQRVNQLTPVRCGTGNQRQCAWWWQLARLT